MRTYGKRFLKNNMKDIAAAKIETRDAMVIDIDQFNGCCRVKIQGSDEYVIAKYPESSRSTPDWLRPGAAVRICHRGGVRNRVEVVSPGQTIPTGTTTGILPDTPTKDCIVSGCELTLPSMRRNAFGNDKGILWVTRGTYRVGGEIRQVKAIRCRSQNALKAENSPPIGALAEQFILSAPSAGLFIYYRIILAKNSGTVSMLSGTASIEPILPNVPDGYLDCGWVLLQSGKVFDEADICANYQPCAACYFLVGGPTALMSGVLSAAYNVTVYDQFAKPITNKAGGIWSAGISIDTGSGYVTASSVLTPTRKITIQSEPGGAEMKFWYHRNIDGVEKSPKLSVEVKEVPDSVNELNIALLNSSGEII